MGGLGIATQFPDFKVTMNELGHVVSIVPEVLKEDTTLKQTEESLDDFLEHYGVKGMKWGVRKAAKLERRSAPSEVKVQGKPAHRGSQAITVKSKAGKGVVKTKGGKRNMATKDAIAVRAARQKARKSTVDALSNEELKKVTERLSLEKKLRDLEKSEPLMKRGKNFIDGLIEAGSLASDLTKND